MQMVYTKPSESEAIERHTIAVLVENEPGVLARVIGLFAGRGYNIESLTVATVATGSRISRINIVTSGTPMIIEQIKHQLQRLVPIYEVIDLTEAGPHIEREVALVKIVNDGSNRREALRIADIFGARATDTTINSFVFSMTGESKKVDSFIELMSALGEVEVSRSGVVAISRGTGVI